MTATLFTEGKVVLDAEATHVVLLLTTGKGAKHSFALPLDSARLLTDELRACTRPGGEPMTLRLAELEKPLRWGRWGR